MKKKINIIYLLFMLFLILLNYITNNSNILTLVLSSSLSILLYNTFSELNINSTLAKYKNKYKVYKIIILFISLIFIIFSVLSFLLGGIIPIKGLNIINTLGVLFTLTIIIIKITSMKIPSPIIAFFATGLSHIFFIVSKTITSYTKYIKKISFIQFIYLKISRFML